MSNNYLPGSSGVADGVPAPASVRIRPKQRTKVSVAESGKILSRVYGGQTYEASFVYNPMHREQAAPIIAFLHSLQGRNGVFRVKLPQLSGVDGIRVGNFVNFEGDTKLHMITETSPLEVIPAPRGGSAVDTQGPYIECSLKNDAQEIKLDRDRLIRLEIDVVERV